ncbi:MAG TPA: glycosyltransferase family 39 protein [Thermoanaerobaculia bacterium]
MLSFVLFIGKHALALALLLVVTAGAGTLAAGRAFSLPLRAALGLMLWAHALFLLAFFGQLRALPMLVLAGVAVAGGVARGGRLKSHLKARIVIPGVIAFAAWFLLALYPPLAFDETLYHLPFVRALAESGELRFLAGLRFPVFPQLHELLCVPLLLLAGDVATHLVSLVEVLLTAALLFDWGRRYAAHTGVLAATLFLGSPLVIHLATIGYADAALTLFVTAGFYCLDRALLRSTDSASLLLAGLFFGTACSTKYLGGYFAVAALVLVAILARPRIRAAATFAAGCLVTALPTTLWLTVTTGNPVFPFLTRVFGATPWAESLPSVTFATQAKQTLALLWSVTFARELVNHQPPLTPLLGAALLIVIAAALRDVRARGVALLAAGYVAIFSFLPQDSRYLVPLLPLVFLAAAAATAVRWPKLMLPLASLAIAPAMLYVIYRVAILGLPPSTTEQRAQMLAKRIPEYTALMHANAEPVYTCGGEHLKYHARGMLLGDFLGPHAYHRVLSGAATTTTIAERLQPLKVRYFLIARRVCTPPQDDGGMDLIYQDAAAQLWRSR